jgi:hypothetical protein
VFVIVLLSRKIIQKFWKKFSIFFFYFFLGGKLYVVPSDTVVTGILDIRPEKHNLHFLVGAELLPHAFVNIPEEKMNIGIFTLIFIIHYIYILNFCS